VKGTSKGNGTRSVAQAVECLLCKHETIIQSPILPKKRKKN
jgi:hypothetical protein